jgi:hypothetical protein
VTKTAEEKRKLKIGRIEFTLLIAVAVIPLIVANIVIISDPKMDISLSFQDGSQVPLFDGKLVVNNDFT